MARTIHPVRESDEALLAHCELRRQRRSGPGGQHRNKVETGVFLTHLPSSVTAAATEKRSQAENRKVAIERLRVQLALKCRVVVECDDTPHETWQARCRHGRVSVSRQHRDFATMLAEAMDFLEGEDHDAARAAERLGCTRSQLTKLFKQEPLAFQLLNEQRQARGLATLR